MDHNWLDTQHRGFSAYLEETAEDLSCKRQNRAIARAVSTEENADTVLLDCIVKMDWIEQIEQALPAIEDAIHQSRQFILRHGETVPVEKAKRVSKASVEHLSRHSELITTQPQPGERLIVNAAVYNAKGEQYPQGVDVAVYFLTNAKEGVCQHFATAATLMYRAFGIPARYTVGFVDTIQKNALVNLTSQDAHAWVEIYVDGLGWVPMEVTGSSLSQDVKTELCIQSCSVTKIYDGKAFEGYDLEQYTILSGTLRKGHRLVVTMAAPGTTNSPGEYMNRIERCVIYDENGKDVTSKYYNIHINYGSLKILPRQITVTIGSASKVYDGQPLTCADYWISQGSLAPGHELKVVVDSILQNPGSMVNSASEVRVLEKNGVGEVVDCSSCYEIIVIPGELEIAQPESG